MFNDHDPWRREPVWTRRAKTDNLKRCQGPWNNCIKEVNLDFARQLAHEKGERSSVQYKEKRGVVSEHFCHLGTLQVPRSSSIAIRISLYRPFEIIIE